MTCEKCGQEHQTAVKIRGAHNRPCAGHKRYSAPGVEIPGGPVPCRKNAMRGQNVCASHGGRAPQNKRAGERRMAEQEAERTLAQYMAAAETEGVDPGEFLLELIYRAKARVMFYTQHALTLTPDQMSWGRTKSATGGQNKGDTFEAKPHFWLVQMREAELDAARLCVDALKVGLKQREIDIAERMADKLVPVIDAFLDAFGIDPAQPENAQKIERALQLVS